MFSKRVLVKQCTVAGQIAMREISFMAGCLCVSESDVECESLFHTGWLGVRKWEAVTVLSMRSDTRYSGNWLFAIHCHRVAAHQLVIVRAWLANCG